MKKVVITGSTGMIGLALIDECLKNFCKVYAVVRPGSKRAGRIPANANVEIIECDLNETARLPELIDGQIDVFYHFGWGHTGTGKFDDIRFQVENIDYTINALRAAKKMGCRLFIGAGSQAEYGLADTDMLSPDSPANPVIAYGVCKLAAGRLVKIEGDKLEIPVVWVRIFSVYGEYDKPSTMIMNAVSKMKEGLKVSFTAGEQLWDYLYSEDAGRAFYMIGEKVRQSKIYCLGSGKARPLREYIGIMRDAVDADLPVGLGDIPYGRNTVMNLCADISGLQNDTGWTPEVSFEEGIVKTVKYTGGVICKFLTCYQAFFLRNGGACHV